MNDYYSILGISNNANENEIKKAYRKLSFEYHPDKNNGDKSKSEIYKKINEAYDTLKDNTKRKQYDFECMMDENNYDSHIEINMNDIIGNLFNNIHKPKKSKNMKSFNSLNPFMNMNENIDDIMFMQFASPGMMFPPQNVTKTNHSNINESKTEMAEHIHVFHEIELIDAYNGCCHPIEIKRQIYQGNQKSEETETLYLDIPKGIDHNEIMVFKERGNIKDKTQSDIKVHIQIKRNDTFERSGMNLLYKHEITFKESILGFSFVLNHLNGQILKLKHPKGKVVLNKSTNVLKKLGIIRDKNVGNLILEFIVKQPEQLTDEQMNQLEKTL